MRRSTLALTIAAGSTAAGSALLEIGPQGTVTGSAPEIIFDDTTTAGQEWEIEGFDSVFGIGDAGGGDGYFQIDPNADEANLRLDQNGNVVLNGNAAQSFNELEVLGNTGGSDTFASVAISPSGVADDSARFTVNSTTNLWGIGSRTGGGGYLQSVNGALGSPTNSLAIASDGDVAVGGIAPGSVMEDFHIGGNGEMYMEGTVGTTGDWRTDLGSTGFFLQNAATGSFPFAVENEAPTDSLRIVDDGDIGIGTPFPTASVDVQGSDGTTLFQVQESSAVNAVRQMMNLRNNGGIRFSLENTGSGDRWDFNNDGAGNFGISFAGTGVTEMRVLQNGNMVIQGTLFELSDRNSKKGFEEVDCDDVLDRISTLPVTTWSYKSDDDSVRHMGPVAQDFRDAFGLGEDDVTIAVSDKIGVSLAGIQALNSKLEAKNAKIADLEANLSDVSERMERLEQALLELSKGK